VLAEEHRSGRISVPVATWGGDPQLSARPLLNARHLLRLLGERLRSPLSLLTARREPFHGVVKQRQELLGGPGTGANDAQTLRHESNAR
jgi:hypothetical protein